MTFKLFLINNLPQGRASCHKVLGLTLCDTLKWKENTNEVITKVSKSPHVLRALKHIRVPCMDFICVYNAWKKIEAEVDTT